MKVWDNCLNLFSPWIKAPAPTAVDPNIPMVAIIGINKGALLILLGGSSKKSGFPPYRYTWDIIYALTHSSGEVGSIHLKVSLVHINQSPSGALMTKAWVPLAGISF